MLDAVKNLKSKPTIIFSSSASVYGNPITTPIPESDRKLPISVYGRTKSVIEDILVDYGNAYGIKSVSLRYFNAAGADPFNYELGQEPLATHLVARVLESALGKGKFSLYGNDYNTPDGTCIRDYVHVWDLAVAHVSALDYAESRTDVSYAFNIGTNNGISNQEIINYAINQFGLSAEYQILPRRDGDPAILISDASLARKELHWSTKFSTIDTIMETAYKWYQKNDTT